MKLCLLPLVLGLISQVSHAQFETVDREKIRTETNDKSSSIYYPDLLKRMSDNDSTLTLVEYRALYYGFVFQKDYSGYADHNKKEINEAINIKDYKKAIELADKILEKIPVSLTANYLKGYALFKLDSSDNSYKNSLKKYRNLSDAILSSGDGLSCNTAFKTIFVTDEYDIMYKYFEIPNHYSQSLVYPCDKFKIDSSQYFQNTEIFFDTSETLLSMQEKHDKKASLIPPKK